MTTASSPEPREQRFAKLRRLNPNLSAADREHRRLRKRADVVRWALQRFAALRKVIPLQIGATRIVTETARREQGLLPATLELLLKNHCDSVEYLRACAAPGAMRHDIISGLPVEPVSEADRNYAQQKLAERGITLEPAAPNPAPSITARFRSVISATNPGAKCQKHRPAICLYV